VCRKLDLDDEKLKEIESDTDIPAELDATQSKFYPSVEVKFQKQAVSYITGLCRPVNIVLWFRMVI